MPLEVRDAIRRDVGRTFPYVDGFEPEDPAAKQQLGRRARSLANVLTAYAAFDPAVSYCQGMNFLGGLLLLLSRGQLCQQVGLVQPWCCSLARQMPMDPCWYQTASLAPCAAVSSRRIAMRLPLPARQRPHRSTMSITTASPPQIAPLSRIAWTSSLAHGVDDLT